MSRRPFERRRARVADGKPLQLAPEAVPKGTRPKKALQIALETGQHSLATLLLRNGYRLDLERYAPLDLALRSRRWDLFDLLLDWGGDLMSVDAAAEDVRKSWPKVPVKIIDEPSHALFVAKPEEFNRVLEEFLTSLPK